MSCKGIFIRHKAISRYAFGHKQCRNCDLFIKWEGSRCPCCGFKLRTAPRNFKVKCEAKRTKSFSGSSKDRIS